MSDECMHTFRIEGEYIVQRCLDCDTLIVCKIVERMGKTLKLQVVEEKRDRECIK